MDERKDCCKVAENLKPEDTGRLELELSRCQVCKCRHFELTVDPGSIGVDMSRIGG